DSDLLVCINFDAYHAVRRVHHHQAAIAVSEADQLLEIARRYHGCSSDVWNAIGNALRVASYAQRHDPNGSLGAAIQMAKEGEAILREFGSSRTLRVTSLRQQARGELLFALAGRSDYWMKACKTLRRAEQIVEEELTGGAPSVHFLAEA